MTRGGLARVARGLGEQPWALAAAVTTLALTVTTIRALAGGVQLIDERALFELRARDVLTADHPFVGLSSSAGVNHPGPLFFDLLAVPVRILGGPVGVTLTVAVINVATIWLSGLAAHRLGGRDVGLIVVAALTILCWTMGTDLLIDPWQPNLLVLPFFALLMLTAAVVGGQHRWLPVVVGLASLCAQTHASYILLAPGLTLVAAVPVAVKARRDWSGSSWRLVALSAVVGLIAWAQPLWQQLFGSGPGNLSRVLTGGDGSERIGWRLAAKLFTAVVAVPPAWWRPGYDVDAPVAPRGPDGTLVEASRLPSLAVAVAILVVLAAAIALCLRAAVRNGNASTSATMMVLSVASPLALVTLSLLPIDLFGAVAHKYRFLWALGAFVAATFASSVLGLVRSLSPRPARWVAAGVVTLAALFAILTVPTRTQSEGDFTRRDVWAVTAELRSQLARVDQPGTMLVATDRSPFIDYFTWAIIAELDRQGVDVVVDSTPALRQLGEHRRYRGSADARLYVLTGPAAGDTPTGAQRIAYVDGGHEWLEVGVFIE